MAEPWRAGIASNGKRLELILKLRFLQTIACLGLLGMAGCGYRSATPSASAPTLGSQPGDQLLVRYFDASRKNIVRGVSMAAHFAGRMPQMKKAAVIEARRKVTPRGTVEYEVLQRDGDNTVQKDLLARFMNAEMESSGDKVNDAVAISPENYKFKYRGQREKNTRLVHVFEVNPRKKRVGLFKGEIWLDAETGLTVLETGRLVKSPSVFLKQVDFEREYEIRDGYSIPKALHTQILTRLWGTAEIVVEYSDFSWDDRPASLARSPVETRAALQ